MSIRKLSNGHCTTLSNGYCTNLSNGYFTKLSNGYCLRNRKHFPCFCRVIETRVEVWENERCCGNTSRRRVFPHLFRVLPNLHECFYNSIETPRKCFLFLLENSPRKIAKNEENLIVLFIIKTYILYTTQYTRHLNLNFFVFLSSYRNTIINQSARVFSLSYFLN